MKRKLLLFISLVLSIFMIGTVNAKEINKAYFSLENEVKYEDTVNGDAFLAGSLIDLQGKINGLGFVLGNNINIDGDLDYGFILGSDVNIKGTINKNIYIAGANITFENSEINQDAYIAGDQITLSGTFNRNSHIAGTKVIIKEGTNLKGNVTIDSSEIVIEKNVKILETLSYNKDAKTNIDKGASINKTVKRKVDKEEKKDYTESISSLVNLLVVFLVIALALPKSIDKTNKLYEKAKMKDYMKTLGIGFAVLLGIPMIALLLLASSIGISLGLIITTFYVIAIYLATAFFGYVIGKLILDKLLKLTNNTYLCGIIGIIIIKGLMIVPYIGGLVGFASLCIGLGIISKLVIETK